MRKLTFTGSTEVGRVLLRRAADRVLKTVMELGGNAPFVVFDDADLDAAVGEWEPASALFAGADGLDDIRLLAAGAPDRLRPGGALVLEIGADQGPAVDDVLRRAGLVDVEIRKDLSDRDRVAIARRPAQAA